MRRERFLCLLLAMLSQILFVTGATKGGSLEREGAAHAGSAPGAPPPPPELRGLGAPSSSDSDSQRTPASPLRGLRRHVTITTTEKPWSARETGEDDATTRDTRDKCDTARIDGECVTKEEALGTSQILAIVFIAPILLCGWAMVKKWQNAANTVGERVMTTDEVQEAAAGEAWMAMRKKTDQEQKVLEINHTIARERARTETKVAPAEEVESSSNGRHSKKESPRPTKKESPRPSQKKSPRPSKSGKESPRPDDGNHGHHRESSRSAAATQDGGGPDEEVDLLEEKPHHHHHEHKHHHHHHHHRRSGEEDSGDHHHSGNKESPRASRRGSKSPRPSKSGKESPRPPGGEGEGEDQCDHPNQPHHRHHHRRSRDGGDNEDSWGEGEKEARMATLIQAQHRGRIARRRTKELREQLRGGGGQ